jgi:hypothetical protein
MCRRRAHASWQTFRMSLGVDCRPGMSDDALAEIIEQYALAGGALLERHAFTMLVQGLRAEQREIAADRHEDAVFSKVPAVGLASLGIPKAGVDHHVAAVADAMSADMVAERLAVILAVRVDRPLVLAAGVAAQRRPPASGCIFAPQPTKGAHALGVVKTIVCFHNYPLPDQGLEATSIL